MTNAVILLHGLARAPSSMSALEEELRSAGYEVLNLGYPSRKLGLVELAGILAEELAQLDDTVTEVSLVTHSMGALVGRLLMSQHPSFPWSRAVFLAPPSKGSQVARGIEAHPVFGALYRAFYGPAGHEVKEKELVLPSPPCSFGVIAGTVGQSLSNPTSWVSRHHFLAGQESDGTLAVEETSLQGMDDFALVEADHTTIMKHPLTIRLVLRFLRTGSFGEASNA